MDDDDELSLLNLLVAYQGFLSTAVEVVEILENEENDMLRQHINEQRRLCRSLPVDKVRPTWIVFSTRISETHFRRQFRMTRDAFTNLCNLLSASVGENIFRSENTILITQNSASLLRRGGLVPGEVKTAIAIRLLAGGSYLDLMPLFDVSVPWIYVIFDEFLDWVLRTFKFPLARTYLHEQNWEGLRNIAEPISYSSDGVLSGIFGALDGLALRIRSPKLTEVSNPGNYYCRKGFFALNVQAICDRIKRFLWCYPSNKGSTHDSAAFANSRLHTGNSKGTSIGTTWILSSCR